MANPPGANGAQDKILRALQLASGPNAGFVTDRLLKAITNIENDNSYHATILRLRDKGHNIFRVREPGERIETSDGGIETRYISGYRYVAPVAAQQMAAE